MPPMHAVPHAPQLFWSLARVTHAWLAPLPQNVSVAGQMHLLPWQIWVVGHGSPQPPQLL